MQQERRGFFSPKANPIHPPIIYKKEFPPSKAVTLQSISRAAGAADDRTADMTRSLRESKENFFLSPPTSQSGGK